MSNSCVVLKPFPLDRCRLPVMNTPVVLFSNRLSAPIKESRSLRHLVILVINNFNMTHQFDPSGSFWDNLELSYRRYWILFPTWNPATMYLEFIESLKPYIYLRLLNRKLNRISITFCYKSQQNSKSSEVGLKIWTSVRLSFNGNSWTMIFFYCIPTRSLN